jgi:Ni,Fe-hydrogenase III large subunit
VNSPVVVYATELAALPTPEPRAWRDELSQRLARGARVLLHYGRRAPEGVWVTSVLQATDRSVSGHRTLATLEAGYPALTPQWPAFHAFERELHEQTALPFADHPWLKPIRYEGSQPSAMSAHPFYVIEGKEVHEVAVGPIHAGVIEPGAFRFMCLGEQVYHLEIQLGYQHRGVEQRLLEGDPCRLAALVETIAGDTSIAHCWAYSAAVESLAGCESSMEIDVARAVALELERVAMHLAALSGLAADIGFLQGATTYGRLRTTAINASMSLCGSRFGRGALRPGGVGMLFDAERRARLRASLELLQRDLGIINECFLGARTVQHRLRSVGVLGRAQAGELGIVGHAARASGITIDARQGVRWGAYQELPIRSDLLEAGDCWARTRLRILELESSLVWLSEILARYSTWEYSRTPVAALAPSRLVVALVEGWRGEVVHALETDAAGRLAHYKVQDPSLRNWMAVALAMRGSEISDFPICNKSFDLSYSGHDL